MISIVMTNGNLATWKKDEYTDYMYDGKVFVVLNGTKWVGIYNIDSVREIRVESEDK